MKHISTVSVSRADTRAVDEPEEYLFFQLFFTVISLMLSTAFSGGKR